MSFDSGALLTQCVRSVLVSTVPVELLVIDNGSTDGSLDALREAVGEDPRVRVLENGANLGFARANNRALVETRGEWLLFLNPDCTVRPDTIARMCATTGSSSGKSIRCRSAGWSSSASGFGSQSSPRRRPQCRD